MFLILLPLSLNVQLEKLQDVWNTFFYDGGDILGLQLIPLITLMKSVSVVVVAFIIYKFIRVFVNKRVFPYTSMDLGMREAFLSILKYIYVIIAIFLSIKSLGISNTVIIFIISGLSVGLGFAMQDLVKNFFAGLVMLIERPVKIGNWVNVNDEIGVVKKISIRATEVLTFDNNSLIVPNNVMITKVVSNETLESTSRPVLPLKISYNHDPKKVIEICRYVIESEKRIFKTPAPEFLLSNYDEYSMEITIRAYCLRIIKIYLLSDLRLKILEVLKENNIKIEYPKLDVYLRDIDKQGCLVDEKSQEFK
ncbi:mechanosensitive ion channel family protein [Francisella orientalis]|nr:mechanosensitive ion channel domain-containing protein [Francisella orientalis]MBK2004450.1 mechanosensitive ion channel [Francisella orientalis]MBK2011644.1 mechanosensitive ion channel [Francisella orientalis]MBK2012683.1 mechanosensitive ion channel [Francisella orientalis]MBK2074350.1 mechanosensitive ion channel [Francisella orientalis]MBK2074897.1 mechanosensitive ion channel [Francisella orientalis]